MHHFAIYTPRSTWEKGDFPLAPFLHLAVGMHTEGQGKILLSAQLMTDSEIDYAVDGLKDELEEFRKKAKKELGSLRAKIG